jgi:hypothetical protein
MAFLLRNGEKIRFIDDSNIVAYSLLVLLPFTVDEDLCALVVGACGNIDFIFRANSHKYCVCFNFFLSVIFGAGCGNCAFSLAFSVYLFYCIYKCVKVV